MPTLARLTPREARARLAEGNRRFLAGDVPPVLTQPGSHRLVAGAQHPYAALLCCADSRVSPEILFSAGLGDLFVVRNAGNTADAAATGSLEYAVAELGVALIGVMGHERCGAVEAAIAVVEEDARLPGAMEAMIAPILPSAIAACRHRGGDKVRAAAEENVRRMVQHLLTRSRIIAEAVEAGRLAVVGGLYDLDEGRVRLVD
ncbi:carbonic anhydrase [Falsiroseomonas oryziterrae]|uniref:carbonic anhydrase n=1 Tax=Falsiroseomonas oryziterrae TaxID=2911368 RepID=UPI001F1AA6F6|nr:carbonic anhydrase [Roseomonas sp. NPKOSM-4]